MPEHDDEDAQDYAELQYLEKRVEEVRERIIRRKQANDTVRKRAERWGVVAISGLTGAASWAVSRPRSQYIAAVGLVGTLATVAAIILGPDGTQTHPPVALPPTTQSATPEPTPSATTETTTEPPVQSAPVEPTTDPPRQVGFTPETTAPTGGGSGGATDEQPEPTEEPEQPRDDPPPDEPPEEEPTEEPPDESDEDDPDEGETRERCGLVHLEVDPLLKLCLL